jgi:hypothetical protein
MPKRSRPASARARAEHCRELAEWTSDARTQHILLDLARELEAEEPAAPAAEDMPLNIPPSLN